MAGCALFARLNPSGFSIRHVHNWTTLSLEESPDGGYLLCFGSKADIRISWLIVVFTLELLAMWRSFGEQVR